MQLSDYTYHLPKEAIAHFPPPIRGTSRLLVLDKSTGAVSHKHYFDLVEYLNPGDVLILNNTKVIQARLIAIDAKGKPVELFLLEQHDPTPVTNRHLVIYRGKLSVGDQLHIEDHAIIISQILPNGIAEITTSENIESLSNTYGQVPLPPYMQRAATAEDQQRYQTVFAKHRGSVAAPTASLNMTEELLEQIHHKGIHICYLTLHVGLGTFAPIKTDDLTNHQMHSEYFVIPSETIQYIRQAKQSNNKVVAVGTTVTRALEYAHKEVLGENSIQEIRGEANIFIYPGYAFKVVDKLVTNFHAPKSTVLMLTAAFAGWNHLFPAYQAALKNDYRFLSYGDSMLIQ